jgi:uncharacterized membrane protein YgaE (UPF0421/DUF939 family)
VTAAARERRWGWVDWLAGTDPGLMRLRLAGQVVIAIGVALAVEWGFAHTTGALQKPVPAGLPAAQALALEAANHALLVIAMLLGAIVAMLGSFAAGMDSRPRSQLATFLLMPVPMIAALCLGLSLHVRLLSLASLAVVLAAGTYCRRFGPRGFTGGMLLFMGAFLGYFLQQLVGLSSIGWLAAEIGLGVAVTILVNFALFYPRPAAAVRRMQRSYAARARALAEDAVDLFRPPASPPPRAGAPRHAARSAEPARRRAARRLHRQLLRLNETALLIDAYLANPAAVPAGWSAAILHQQLFDAEVALSNTARFALALADRDLPGPLRTLIDQALVHVRDQDLAAAVASARALRRLLAALPSGHPSGHPDHDVSGKRGQLAGDGVPDRPSLERTDRVLVHRLATSVTDFSQALQIWLQATAGRPELPDPGPAAARGPDRQAEQGRHGRRPGPGQAVRHETAAAFQTPVATLAGWLPGTATVSADASLEPGSRPAERFRMAPYVRVAIQIGIAVGGAIAVGDALSGRRFYWAVIAAFVTFMGANTSGEQVRKSFFRVAGTLVGVIAGSALAQLVGDRVGLQITVVLLALFLGLYLMRVNYAFMVIGITVMVSQLYVELDEFSNSLLLLRLEETALGAAVAMATVLLVLPLRTGRVARVAARQHLSALADLVDRCLDRLLSPSTSSGSDLELRAAARRLDIAYQALAATARPLRTPLLGRLADHVARFMQTATATRYYARNLILDASTRHDDVSPGVRAELGRARSQLADSVAAITAALDPPAAGAGNNRDRTRPRAGPAPSRYVRSASLFAQAAGTMPERGRTSRTQLALRDLQLLDSSLAEAARWAGVTVSDLDTTPARAWPDTPTR